METHIPGCCCVKPKVVNGLCLGCGAGRRLVENQCLKCGRQVENWLLINGLCGMCTEAAMNARLRESREQMHRMFTPASAVDEILDFCDGKD